MAKSNLNGGTGILACPSRPAGLQKTLANRFGYRHHSVRRLGPLGSDGVATKIETLLGRRVRALPSGRQKRWRKAK